MKSILPSLTTKEVQFAFFCCIKYQKPTARASCMQMHPWQCPYSPMCLGTSWQLLFLCIFLLFSLLLTEKILSSHSLKINAKPFGCFVHHIGSLALVHWVFKIPSRNWQHLILLIYSIEGNSVDILLWLQTHINILCTYFSNHDIFMITLEFFTLNQRYRKSVW